MSTDTVTAAFAAGILKPELNAIDSHAPRRGEPPGPEEVHRMRIAARRIRVALKLFADAIPADDSADAKRELRWFSRALGNVRDLDVYTERLPACLAAIGGTAPHDLEAYARELVQARERAHRELTALFADERYARMRKRLRALIAATQRRVSDEPIEAFAMPRVERAVKRILKRGRRVRPSSDFEELHKLRIDIKRLRYQLEFFLHVAPALQTPAKAAKTLQDLLGEVQDAVAAANRLHAYALDGAAAACDGSEGERTPSQRSPASSQVFTLGRLMQAQHHCAEDGRRRFAEQWPLFEKEMKRLRKRLRAEDA